ncbi:uncharacterized protein STEHIDRAFT_172849 [Stereum hirsutum FP-91666 SS1]|uniref:F-box domain-containing protein n=1 Tax=Stereum hirsutum (strain FP-91666) TaxID=721885 RepID=R7RXR5_STEHR|nr:uncharacterized protein STEHIDRAFT_172849 [Stereum hirsutum FP-91666 SS1]EIM80201.1 hypothetical protein STEHIDRAFT_172849 [Stereum hirsutum FP-91666 SS1]
MDFSVGMNPGPREFWVPISQSRLDSFHRLPHRTLRNSINLRHAEEWLNAESSAITAVKLAFQYALEHPNDGLGMFGRILISLENQYPNTSRQLWHQLAQPRLAVIYSATFSPNTPPNFRPTILSILLKPEIRTLADLQPPLRSARNSLRPIARLAPETLAYCFLLLRSQEVQTFLGPKPNHDPTGIQGLLAITHVCRRWRDVAIDCKALWRHLDTSCGSKWFNTMLSRAGSLPLVVSAEYAHEPDLSIIRWSIAPNINRIESLSLSAPFGNALTKCLACLPRELPTLKELKVEASYESTSTELMPVDRTFLGKYTPLLSNLALLGVEFYEPLQMVVPNITSLFLSLTPASDFRVTPDDLSSWMARSPGDVVFGVLLDVLEQLPSLRYLTIIKYLRPPESGDLFSHPIVRLLDLRSLTLFEDAAECVRLLRHLYIPPTALRHISAKVRLDDAEDVDAHVDALEDAAQELMLHDGMQSRMRMISIEAYSENESQLPEFFHGEPEEGLEKRIYVRHWLDACPGEIDDFIPIPQTVPDIRIALKHSVEDNVESRGFPLVNAVRKVVAMEFSAVETLSLPWFVDAEDKHSDLLNAEWWIAGFGQMHQLRHVEACARVGHALIEALVRHRDFGDTTLYSANMIRSENFELYHPQLTHIALSQIDFDECRDGKQTTYEMLHSALSTRSASGCPVQWLLIEMSTITKQSVDELSRMVESVLWDEDWGSREDEDSATSGYPEEVSHWSINDEYQDEDEDDEDQDDDDDDEDRDDDDDEDRDGDDDEDRDDDEDGDPGSTSSSDIRDLMDTANNGSPSMV